jgi:hypothetical protein
VPGLSGRLISSHFACDRLPTLDGYCEIPNAAARTIEHVAALSATALGPASSVRAVADSLVVPFMRALGFAVVDRADDPRWCVLHLTTDAARGDCASTVALVVGYGQPLSTAWRESVRRGVGADARWAFCSNGVSLRIVDARRTWSRDALEFDLAVLAENHITQSALWSLARAESLASSEPLLDRVVALSARHGVDVCRALGEGVLEALQVIVAALVAKAGRRYTPGLLFEHSLTVLYRILFLLFAEARGLVPLWHPVYRDRYSLETIVSSLLLRQRPRGLWQALRAISYLAHSGCTAGELAVTAFNGPLFAPVHAAAFDRTFIDDDILANALVAVGTTTVDGSRARIAYRDLDVEQLGAVYEHILDYEPRPRGRAIELVRAGDIRKATGTFYTPRGVTSHLVQRVLNPLVEGRTSDEILTVRVLDPAMGSGAFLVAACRYLASATELALIREGRWHPHDISAADRIALRRQIASRCLFGVDLNPMAVQLARLSLWLATLAADKPLSFLDHHLVPGNSLVGATPDDLRRQPAGGRRRGTRHQALPLFEAADPAGALAESVAVRTRLATDADDSAAIVRSKERSLEALTTRDAPLERWSRALDLWCAGWFWDDGPAPDRRLFSELMSHVVDGTRQLSSRTAAPLLEQARAVAARHGFLHWPIAFPEVFYDADGLALANGGFDAVVGNPPWDMVRGDSGEDSARLERRSDARHLTDFVREAGIYKVETRAHANRYQLFVERALRLVRTGGRVGLVLPSGIASDAGAAPLRRYLFDRADIDEITGLDNREGIFPIHRSVRFILLTCTAGRATAAIQSRFGITSPEVLEQADGDAGRVTLTRAFLSRLSGGDDLGIPEIKAESDLRLLERLNTSCPRLSSPDGWNAQFGRELNATDDRHYFEPFSPSQTARPVIEGKQIEPFRVSVDRSRYQLKAGSPDRIARRARLAYRDVASATNRLTLIAAIIPARAVTTHTLFCLKTPLSLDAQHVLCGLLNSYVANYLVRFRVNTHVTASLMSRLPVPFVAPDNAAFDQIGGLVRELLKGRAPVEEMEDYVALQAVVARLYGLSSKELEHVLSTFPLVPKAVRSQVLHSFLASAEMGRGGAKTRRL